MSSESPRQVSQPTDAEESADIKKRAAIHWAKMDITFNAILTGNYVTKGKVTGGKRGYVAAIQKAYSDCAIANLEIRYSHQRGFYVEGTAVPWEDDVVWYEHAGYHDDGSKMACPAFYTETRRHICASS